MEIKWMLITLLIIVVRLQYTFVSAQRGAAPTNVYFQVHPLNYLTVSWTPPADLTGVIEYLVEYTIGGVRTVERIGDTTVTTVTFQDNNLVNPLDSVVVIPTQTGPSIDPNNIVQAIDPPANAYPPAPIGAIIQQTLDTSFTITWVNPGNVDGFVISYARNTVTGFAEITSIDLPVGMTSEQILGLMPNANYEFNLYSQRNGIRTLGTLTVQPPFVGTTPTTVSIPIPVTTPEPKATINCTSPTTVSIPIPVTTPEPKATINYTLFIAVTVIVLLLLVIVAILCYKRRNSTSDPKNANGEREQSGNQSQPSTELRSSPLSVVSRKYDTAIEMTSPKDDPLPEEQPNHEYEEPSHSYTEIL